jgi:hypothetical protein
MGLMLKPLHPVFVAEASGLDLTQPSSPRHSARST